MNSPLFKKSVIISCLWHLTVFSIFSVSSGSRFFRLNYAGVYFWGQVLNAYDFMHRPTPPSGTIKELFFKKPGTAFLDKNRKVIAVSSYYLKPQVNLALIEEKKPYAQNINFTLKGLAKKESVVMFYPPLPYHLLLYFKDRQQVHIELMFNVVSGLKVNYIEIKRKISSGNLEVDLLTARYLSHYLFIRQMGFPVNSWQTVKIELSPKDD